MANKHDGSQGVKVRVGRHYRSKYTKRTITRIHLPVGELGKLVGVVTTAMHEGLGTNKRGEIQLFLTNYDATQATNNGRLGIVRAGSREKLELEKLEKQDRA